MLTALKELAHPKGSQSHKLIKSFQIVIVVETYVMEMWKRLNRRGSFREGKGLIIPSKKYGFLLRKREGPVT